MSFSLTEEQWTELVNTLDKMYASIMEQFDRIYDKLDTIETTVDNIENNMPVEDEP